MDVTEHTHKLFGYGTAGGGLRSSTATGALSVAKRSYPTSEVRGGSWEEQPHVQRAVAAWAQKGLEELFHVQGQEGRW